MYPKPNLIERLERVATLLDDIRDAVLDRPHAITDVDVAHGIISETLTMIDGRSSN